jgi:hypothetical protein
MGVFRSDVEARDSSQEWEEQIAACAKEFELKKNPQKSPIGVTMILTKRVSKHFSDTSLPPLEPGVPGTSSTPTPLGCCCWESGRVASEACDNCVALAKRREREPISRDATNHVARSES